MNKRDIWPFVVLLGLLFAWPVIDAFVARKFYPDRVAAKPAPVEQAPAEAVTPELAAAPEPAAEAQPETPAAAVEPGEAPGEQPPARLVALRNERVEIVFSSRGGTVTAATLKEYRAANTPDSGPMVLDFGGRPALAYEDASGLGDGYDFALAPSADGRTVTFERTTANGLRLRRTVTLGDAYLAEVRDELVNTGAEALALKAHGIRVGPMQREAGHKDGAGIVYLGVDTLSPGGEKVQHWGGKLGKLFDREMEEGGLAALPVVLDVKPRPDPVDWIAAKNKYFVQILTPEGGAEACRLYARRERTPREAANPAVAQRKMTPLAEVGASVVYDAQVLQPGETLERKLTYYVGPKKYTELHALRLHQIDVMEFGMWAPVGKVLLRILNFIHDHVPPYNYGIAIILLTVIVRVLFWPITHKSTESMKRMAQVAPLVNEIRAKYKDNPQKQQQEIMALYKEHKVNPLGGCLPMLVQIPVFIALFVVLRSAIELRFASFLWIRDLSEPENLLAGMLPFGLSLNTLPLLMAGTMYLQMKLSPSAGDPAQQKIMALMMPAMMLVFLYNFAAGLALYWTTQNLLMIVQQMMMKQRAEQRAAPVAVKK